MCLSVFFFYSFSTALLMLLSGAYYIDRVTLTHSSLSISFSLSFSTRRHWICWTRDTSNKYVYGAVLVDNCRVLVTVRKYFSIAGLKWFFHCCSVSLACNVIPKGKTSRCFSDFEWNRDKKKCWIGEKCESVVCTEGRSVADRKKIYCL